jgi:hypothetical protein
MEVKYDLTFAGMLVKSDEKDECFYYTKRGRKRKILLCDGIRMASVALIASSFVHISTFRDSHRLTEKNKK